MNRGALSAAWSIELQSSHAAARCDDDRIARDSPLARIAPRRRPHQSRRNIARPVLRLFAALFVATVPLRAADSVNVAAAANLVHAVDALNTAFRETEPATRVAATIGASGSLFAQLRNGAPFDVFLSADTEYPRAIAAGGLGDAASIVTFATGRLVVWTRRADVDVTDWATAVRSPTVKIVALAQPRTAPYGRAAEAALAKLDLGAAAPRRVWGENIAQTAQFVETGHADLGFVALSLIQRPDTPATGKWAEVPRSAYAAVSLDHAAILTRRGAANAAARRYVAFLLTPAATKIFRAFGYDVPAPASAAAATRPPSANSDR